MPRANRYILPGYIYHLTHRCHDRKFLLKFAKDRNQYRGRLREAVLECDLSLLSYNITSNHVHLIAYSDHVDQIASFMQQAAGEFARDYNRRKSRTGAFWEGRYQATIVDSGRYLWECLKYVELNMVRCRAVEHPRDWQWSGYNELMGIRRRNRLLDVDKLLYVLGGPRLSDFRQHFDHILEQAIIRDELKKDAKWTQSLAVGSQNFVEGMGPLVRNRQSTQYCEDGAAWILKETSETYGSLFDLEKRPIMPFGASKST